MIKKSHVLARVSLRQLMLLARERNLDHIRSLLDDIEKVLDHGSTQMHRDSQEALSEIQTLLLHMPSDSNHSIDNRVARHLAESLATRSTFQISGWNTIASLCKSYGSTDGHSQTTRASEIAGILIREFKRRLL